MKRKTSQNITHEFLYAVYDFPLTEFLDMRCKIKKRISLLNQWNVTEPNFGRQSSDTEKC